jgi:hypothetical protein
MKYSMTLLLPVLLLPAAALTACSGGTASEVTNGGDQDLTANPLSGYYEFSEGDEGAGFESIYIETDGSWVGPGHSDVSGSGNDFFVGGTSTVKTNGGAFTLVMHSPGQPDFSYGVARNGDSVTFKILGTSFTMKRKKIVTLTFDASWNVQQSGPLIAGEALLVRYAAGRIPCSVPAGGALFSRSLCTVDNRNPIGLALGSDVINGFIRQLGSVPDGSKLAVWFETGGGSNSQVTCRHVDSKFGQNYQFDILR